MWVQVLICFHQDTLLGILERHIFWAILCPFYSWGKCKGLYSPLQGAIPCSALILHPIFLNSGYASPQLFELSCWVL